MIRRPPRSTQSRSSAASDVYKRQGPGTLGHSADGFLTRLSLLMPAFSLVWRPPLGHPATSLATRRSPTHPHAWITRTWLLCECHSFGGMLEPRYIVGAESLDQ